MALEIIRQATAGLLEAPEQALNITGQALQAVGDMLEAMATRIDELEALIRGQDSSPQEG